jgi:hypothetical protein
MRRLSCRMDSVLGKLTAAEDSREGTIDGWARPMLGVKKLVAQVDRSGRMAGIGALTCDEGKRYQVGKRVQHVIRG